MMLGVAFGGLGSMLSGANLLKMGMMAASAVGMYLLGGGKEKGEIARLDDLKVSSSAYGRGIPIVFGTMRVTGTMFWATDFDEELRYTDPKNKGGKKGSKKGTPYYAYFANFAMMICEGPVEELLRVWADSNLIFDKHNPDNEDIVGPGFSRPEEGGGKTGFVGKKKGNDGGDSGRFQFRYYAGTESQMPDPFMVQEQGPDMVPAHRGYAYLFFERMALEDFGNRTPTITMEVATVKKQVMTVRTMDNMPNPEGLSIPGGALTYIDPERYRLYQEENLSGVGRVMRIYDLSSNREIRRVPFREIDVINGWRERDTYETTGDRFIRDCVGVAGNGDIIFRITGRNSATIAFVDPHTFHHTKIFGVTNHGLSNTTDRIVSAQNSTPAGYIDLEINIFTGEIEIVPKRATVITSFGGWFYIFSEFNEPLGYFSIPGGFTTGFGRAMPYKVDLWGGSFMVLSNHNTGFTSRLISVDWNLNVTSGATIDGQETKIENGPVGPNVKLIRELSTAGNQTVLIEGVQLMANTQEVIWFERFRSNDPLLDGVWIVAVPVEEVSRDHWVWREKINDNFNYAPGGPTIPINTGGSIKYLAGGYVWDINILAREVSFYGYGNQLDLMTSGTAGQRQTWWPARNAIIAIVIDPTDGERKWAMVLLDRNQQIPVDVHFIVSDLAQRVGIPEDRLDLSELNEQEIMGYMVENPRSARSVVEELAQIFMFDVAEIDYRLKAVSRGNEHKVTIPQKDLGVVDGETGDYYIEQRVQEIDLPQTVVINYINPDHDYQTNAQHYRRPRSPMPVMQSRDKLEIQLAMAMKNDFAKQLAHKVNMSLWTERMNYDTLLPWTYLQYDPTDVFEYVMDDGLTFVARIMKMDLGANFAIETTGVAQTIAAYTSDARGSFDGGVIRRPKRIPPQVEPVAWDIPYLEDGDSVGDNQFNYYWGIGAYAGGFRAGILEYRYGARDWGMVGIAPQEVVWGRVADPVPPPPWGPWATDDVNVITLLPAHEYEDDDGYTYPWESIQPSQWPSTENTVIIGGEIIYFRDVNILPTGAVEISHLIRGARGTENKAYHHEGIERFTIVTSGLRTNQENMAARNQDFQFRAFSSYTLFPPFGLTVKMKAESHKPWAPSRFRRQMISADRLQISWERRTRLGGEMVDGTGSIPLNEESQRFEVYILHEPFDINTFDPDDPSIVKRSWLDVSNMFVNYTSAQRATDGYDVADPLHVVIFQISGQVGRGFPGYATLYPSILI